MSDIASDDDSSSTEQELDKLKAKLAELKYSTQDTVNAIRPTNTFEFPSSDEDSLISRFKTEDVLESTEASSSIQVVDLAIQSIPKIPNDKLAHTRAVSTRTTCVRANMSSTVEQDKTAMQAIIRRVPKQNPYLPSSNNPSCLGLSMTVVNGAIPVAPASPGTTTPNASPLSPSSSSSSSSSSLSGSSSGGASLMSSSDDEASNMGGKDSPGSTKKVVFVPTHMHPTEVATPHAVSRTQAAEPADKTGTNKPMNFLKSGDLFVGDCESEEEEHVPHYTFPPLHIRQVPSKNITPSPAEIKKPRECRPLEQVESSLTVGGMVRSPSKDTTESTVLMPPLSELPRSNMKTNTNISFSLQDLPQYQWPTQGFNQHAEIDRSVYAPPLYQPKTQPALHRLHETNRPKHSRRQILVAHLFQSPVSLLWRGKFDKFNALQSELAERLCHTSDHMVVSAPTGAGKTALFEMAIARFISEDLQQSNTPSRLSNHRKMVYIAPSKALSEERYHDWTKRLSALNLGIEVAMITGENNEQGGWHQDLMSAHLILTTPEKWDSITRKWTDIFFLLASVKLLLIDEVHLLGDDSRGSCLEAVLSRMKSIERAATTMNTTRDQVNRSSFGLTTPAAVRSPVRTIAVSATLPNIVDVAEFVGAHEAFTFDSSFRPVPLQIDVHACGFLGKNEFKFWESLAAQVPPIIQCCAENKQTLIFCHTKKDTENLCKVLIEKKVGNPTNTATSAVAGTMDYNLFHRVAFHHAGMPPEDKVRVEKAFSSGEIRCLCATSTLAVGVNLPAHLVIIKGTRAWRGTGNGYQDIDKQSLLQMIGRAGRPGLDTSGRAIIMTDNKSKSLIESRIQGLGPAESRLLGKLKDVLATEIAQGVVTSMDTAIAWFKTTFLFVRLRQNPSKYAMDKSWRTIDEYLEHLIETALKSLACANLIEFHQSNAITAMPGCHIMSQRMVSFESMRALASLPHDATICQILITLSKMDVFNSHVFRNEKKELNECHKGACMKYYLSGQKNKVRIQEPWEKAFVLLQAFIGGHRFESFALRHQMTTFGDAAIRLLEAAEEYSTKGSRHGYIAAQCKKLRRCLYFSLWGENDGLLRQVNGMSHEAAARLKIAGISTFDQVMQTSPAQIEKASGRPSPFGLHVKTWVSTVLKSRLTLSAAVTFTTGANLAADVTCSLTFVNPIEAALSDSMKTELSYVMLAYTDQPGSCALFRDNISGPLAFNFSPPPRFGKLFIVLIASIIGLDQTLVLDGNIPVMPSSFVEAPRGQTRTVKNKNGVIDEMSRTHTPYTRNTAQNAHFTLQESCHTPQPQAPNDPPPRSRPIGRDQQNPARTFHSPHQSASQGDMYTRKETAEDSAHIPKLDQRVLKEQDQWTPAQNVLSSTLGCGGWEQTGGLRQKLIPQRGSPRSDATLEQSPSRFPSSVATIYPSVQSRLTVQGRADRNIYSGPESRGARKRDQVPGAWQTNKKKQQRTQQRAFASKNDNPFSSFQHDPNDAESFLDGLSQATRHPIIPREELRRFDTALHTRCSPSVWSDRARFTPSGDRRRSQIPRNGQALSNHDILRMKAQEADAYTKAFAATRMQSPYCYGPGAARPTPTQNRYSGHNHSAYVQSQGERICMQSNIEVPYQDPGAEPRQWYSCNTPCHHDDFPSARQHEIHRELEHRVSGALNGIGAYQARYLDFPYTSQLANRDRMQIETQTGAGLWSERHATQQSQCDFSFLVEDEEFYQPSA